MKKKEFREPETAIIWAGETREGKLVPHDAPACHTKIFAVLIRRNHYQRLLRAAKGVGRKR